PLTFSLSLAVALGLCSVSKAGLHDNNCATCGLASPQGVVPSAQGVVYGCEAPCPPKHHFNWHLPSFHCHLPKIHHEVCYEWVLKKKPSGPFHHDHCDPWGGAPVYATGQAVHGPPPQHAAAPVYGAGQRAFLPARSTTAIASVPAEMTPAIPRGE